VFEVTGVVRKHNPVLFEFFDSSWNLAATHLTYFSDNNCVVRHEPERFNTARLPIGTVRVDATFLEWETDQWMTRQVGTLTVLEAPPPPPPGDDPPDGCYQTRVCEPIPY
jgi:hypothetical protein